MTGFIADELTPGPRRYTEFFIPGTEPDALRAVPWRMQQWGALPLLP